MAALHPYNKSILVSVFVRLANAQANPNDFLFNLLSSNFETITADDATVRVSVSTGGSSANFILPPNMSRMDIMEIAELALRNIETGVDAPATTDANGNTTLSPIGQVLPSQRILSYAQFGSMRR